MLKEKNQNSQKEKQSVEDLKKKQELGKREKCVASQLTGEQHRDHLVVWEEASL